MEPFSTSAFKALVWIFATTTKICTRGGSTRARALGFRATAAALLLVEAYPFDTSLPCRRRPGMGPTLQRHPFSGL